MEQYIGLDVSLKETHIRVVDSSRAVVSRGREVTHPELVAAAIRTQTPGDDQVEGLTLDLSQIDMEKLRDEFAKEVRHKATALQDIREIVEQKLTEMLARNPARMDYQQKYEEIVADYNREKDRVTIEETFRRLTELMGELDAEQKRAVEKGLSEDKLALFDFIKKDNLGKAERERVKQASRDLLAAIKAQLATLDRFWEKEQTKADIKVFILDEVYASLPTPPFTPREKETVAAEVYAHVCQQAVSGGFAWAARHEVLRIAFPDDRKWLDLTLFRRGPVGPL